MKRIYQIEKQRALQQFRKEAGASKQQVQLTLPPPEVLALVQRGLMNLALAAFRKLAAETVRGEVTALVGPKNQANGNRENVRWGAQTGYCVVGGQKVPLRRPRMRDVRNREVPLGSYQMLQQASLMEEAVWTRSAGLQNRKVHGGRTLHRGQPAAAGEAIGQAAGRACLLRHDDRWDLF